MALPRVYCNSTLEGNWYEDRLSSPRRSPVDASEQRTLRVDKLIKATEPSTFRTQTVDYPTKDDPYCAADTISGCITTKQDMDSHLSEVLKPKRKPLMVNCENLREALSTGRPVLGPQSGFGSILPRHQDQGTAEQFLTTNKKFFVADVEKAKTMSPGSFRLVTPKTTTGKLYRDSHTFGKNEGGTAGHAGNRGEMSRHPGESGSAYGCSVFVDEYSKWGTKLHGMQLSDSIQKRCTNYLDS